MRLVVGAFSQKKCRRLRGLGLKSLHLRVEAKPFLESMTHKGLIKQAYSKRDCVDFQPLLKGGTRLAAPCDALTDEYRDLRLRVFYRRPVKLPSFCHLLTFTRDAASRPLRC